MIFDTLDPIPVAPVDVARAVPVVMLLSPGEALERADGDVNRAADMLCVHAPRGCCHCRFSVQREALRRDG